MSKRELTQISPLPALSRLGGAALLGSFSAQLPLHSLLGGYMAPQEGLSCGLRCLAALSSSAVLLRGCQLSSHPLSSQPSCLLLPLLPPANTAVSSIALHERMILPHLACNGPEAIPAAQLPAAQHVPCRGPQHWPA